jgi:EmrB/QacA subfamily drug resistance transporter
MSAQTLHRPAPPGAGVTTSTNRHGAITAVVCLALASVVSAMASLNVALPSIARATHASQTQLEWIIDAYSLIFAALLLPAGAIGDKFGRRRTLIVGLAIFGAGSALAMTANGATELIVLRGVLGLGAALVMPATLSTITSTFPTAQRTKAVGVWAGVAGGSAVLGLLTSGLVLQVWSWRSVFAVNVVLAIVAIIGTLRVVPESADKDAPKLDLVGAALAVLGLTSLVYSIIEAPEQGWLDVHTLVGVGAGLLVLAGFVIWELRTKNPLIDPRLFRLRGLSAGTLSITIQFFAFFGFVFALLQYMQGVRGDSPLMAAVSVLPMAGALMPMSRIAPILVARIGARRVNVIGLVIVAAGMVTLAQLDTSSSYWLVVAGLVPLGAGMGMAMTPATSAITEALPKAQQGVGSALNDLARELGGALGIAVLGSVLTAGYRGNLSLPGVPSDVAHQAKDSFAVGNHMGGSIAEHANSAFMTGMHSALYVAAGAALLAAVTVAGLLRKGGAAAEIEQG